MHPNQPAAQRQRVLAHIADTDVGGFFDPLSAPQLLDRVEALQPPFRKRVYSPTETPAIFMTQTLSEDGSYRAVVNAAAVRRVLDGEAPLATNTSAYCQARARLPLPMIATLAREAAGLVTKTAPGWWLWQVRRVRLVDGATVTLSDTPQNQAKYPQPASQKAGLGFPIARLVALVCIVVTTLLCPKTTPKSMLKMLYRQRRHIELDLRNLKTTLGMEHLRCKTPTIALKEVWVYLLAYTLIRLLMAQAALVADQIPRQLSFKHVVQMWGCVLQCGGTRDSVCIHALLIMMAEPRVGRRSGRIEPRALKRRLKSYPLLTKPRKIAQEEVRQHGHPAKQR
jgi:hypothetical protein